jgi:hypothetical protein
VNDGGKRKITENGHLSQKRPRFYEVHSPKKQAVF